MSESRLSGPGDAHLSDDRLIAELYGVGSEDAHLAGCEECRARLARMEARREQVAAAEDVSSEYLTAQRRQIYAALYEQRRRRHAFALPRWAPAGAAALALAASLFYYGEQQRAHHHENAISDAQLAQEVSQIASAPEDSQTAPLEGLFVE